MLGPSISHPVKSNADKLSRELGKAKADLAEAQKKCDCMADEITGLEARLGALHKELEQVQVKANREQLAHQQQTDELHRQIAKAENRFKAQNDAIADVVTPIRRQVEDAKNAAMSEALCKVLLTHLDRIIDALKTNGFEV